MAAADTLELLAGIRQHAAMGFVAPFAFKLSYYFQREGVIYQPNESGE